jgi:hypothetical protein
MTFQYAYPGLYEAWAVLESAYGTVRQKRRPAEFTVLERPPKAVNPPPAAAAPLDPVVTAFEDSLTYIPLLNLSWRTHRITPLKMFGDTESTGARYYFSVNEDAPLEISLKSGKNRIECLPGVTAELPPGASVTYKAAFSEAVPAVFDVIRRKENEPDRIIRIAAVSGPAYGELAVLIIITGLLAALAVFGVVSARAAESAVVMTFNGESMYCVVERKMTVWDALNMARDNLIIEGGPEGYERAGKAFEDFPDADMLSRIHIKPVKGGAAEVRDKAGRVSKAPDGSYEVKDGERLILSIKGGAYVQG